jgi:hypothetical protein
MVEQPMRHLRISNARTFVLGATATAAAAFACLLVLTSGGFRDRLPENMQKVADRKAVRDWKCAQRISGLSKLDDSFKETKKKGLCIIGTPWKDSSHKAVLWGDSHAGHFVQLLDYAAKQNNVSIAYYFSCPPYLDNEKIIRPRNDHPNYSENCGAERKEILRFLEGTENIDLVILSAYWSSHYRRIQAPGKPPGDESGLELMRQGLSDTIASIDPSRIPVLIISDVPGAGRDMNACVVEKATSLLLKECQYDVSSRDISDLENQKRSNRVLAEIAESSPGIRMLNSQDRLCDDRKCDNYINNEFIYRDSSHMRINLSPDTLVEMARRLGLVEAIRSALKTDKAASAVTLTRDGGKQNEPVR